MRGSSTSMNGSSRSRLAPMPLQSTSGGPGSVPGRTDTRIARPRTVTNRRRPLTWGPRRIVERCWRSDSMGWSHECTDTGDVSSDDEGLYRLGAFVGVQGLHVGHVPHDVEVEQDAVAAEQVARLGHHLACLAGVVHLGNGGYRVAEA